MFYNPYREMQNQNVFFPPCRDLPQRLIKALEGEQDAIEFYRQLINMAPAQQDKDIISEILSDERKHFKNFSRLYFMLTGKQPNLPPPKRPTMPNYMTGLGMAIMDETEAYEFYRDTFLCTNNPTIKEVFLEAFTDENQHAVRLNYLFTKNKK